MEKCAISRIVGLGIFFASVMSGIGVMAQTSAHTPTSSTAQQTAHPKGATDTKEAQNTTESYPACEHIVTECKKLGFIVGEYKQDNGVWGDCFDPVISGQNSTRKGKPLNVSVNSFDLWACRAQTNTSCQRVLAECSKQGFIAGEVKEDNGLWGDCFDPLVNGQSTTRKGRTLSVPVNSNDIEVCRATEAPHKH
jgi:hypothetical protein